MEIAAPLKSAEEVARDRWLKERRSGLGGSDAAAVLGLSKWSSPLHVWLEKRGELLEEPNPEREEWLWWGRQMEPLIATRYAMKTNRKIWNPDRLFRSEKHPFLVATPDRLCVDDPIVVEIKTARRGDEWGQASTDDLPAEYLIQVVVYMAVCDVNSADVAVLIAGSDFRIYHVERDLELEEMIIAKLGEWWSRHMISGEPVPVDGHEKTREWLSRKFAFDLAPLIPTSPYLDDLGRKLEEARKTVDVWSEAKTRYENLFKEQIGESSGVHGNGFKVSWKRTRGSRETDWESVSVAMMGALDGALGSRDAAERVLSTCVEAATREKPGFRRFLFTPAKAKVKA